MVFSLLRVWTYVGVCHSLQDIYLVQTHCHRLKTLNLCDRVTITFPIILHLMPITSTLILLYRNSNPVSPSRTLICFKLTGFLDPRQKSLRKVPSMRRYGRWGMDLLLLRMSLVIATRRYSCDWLDEHEMAEPLP